MWSAASAGAASTSGRRVCPGSATRCSDFRTLEALARKLLPVYALALDLPREYFLPLFDGAHINLRLSHYPAGAAAEDNQFGIAPHADAGFMTLFPQSAVPRPEIPRRGGRWLA